MKKILAVLTFLLIGAVSYAQWIGVSPGDLYTTLPVGKVGIGTTTPGFILDVVQTGTEPKISITNNGGAGGAAFRMYDVNSNTDWRFKSAGTGTFKIRDNTNAVDVFVLEKGTGTLNAFYVKSDGNVGIGTTNPLAKLSVNGAGTFNGKVKCTEIEVLLTAWPDHVFKSDYSLMPLDEVENFISVNKHLPGVPSEKEVLVNGNNLGEMDAVLLKKIEELTLYVIQLKKETEMLKQQLAK